MLASVLMFSVTGYAWGTMHGLVSGLTMADVIGSDGGGPAPADGATDILLVGMDSRTDAQGNPLSEEMMRKLKGGMTSGGHNTDTLILLHIPNNGSKAVAISVPRDSYVRIPGFGKHKVNSAYARAKLAARKRLKADGVTDPAKLTRRSDEQGAKTLIGSIENLVGFTVDHYASINLLGFYSITKAVGGVKVCLKNPVHDPLSGADFPAGVQQISGADALAFVRQRHGLPRGDLDRIERQQAFMAGLARRILSAGTLTDPGKLSALVDAIRRSVVLDQGWDILSFAKRMRGLSAGQIEFYTVPVVDTSYQTPNDGVAVRVNPTRVHEWVESLDDASRDGAGSSGKQQQNNPDKRRENRSPAPKRVDPATITVEVRNGNGTTDLASDVSASLTKQGFTRGVIGNTAPRQTTVVQVAPGERAAGRQVAATLHGRDIPVRESPSVRAGHVTVLLGADYSLPASGTGPRGADNPAAPAPGSQGAPPGGKGPKPIDAQGIPCVN